MTEQLHDPNQFHFASDNYAGAHPAVLDAIATANGGHVGAYGDDPYTERLREVMKGHFGEDAEVYPVFNGTGANVVALQAMTPRWGTVLTSATAHIDTDEQAAPERVGGLKIKSIASVDGRLAANQIEHALQATSASDQHRAHPQVLSYSNSTELGTIYTPGHALEIARVAREHGLRIHVDGARLANAAAATDTSLDRLTEHADVVSLGGTKIGGLVAEAIVVRDPAAVEGVPFIRKYSMQLASKQRFVAAQLLALYETDLWLENARHANRQAQLLATKLAAVPGCEVPLSVEANAAFVRLPPGVADRVRERGFRFYDWPLLRGAVRLMTSWDTTDDAVDRLVAEIATAAAN